MTSTKRAPTGRHLLSKVPEVTIYFWVIKVLCTTVGETAADFLNVNLNFGLTGTSIVTGVLLAVALVFQFRATRYLPALYWFTVALVSVFGTLVTDNLTDNLGLPLEASTLIFGALLAVTFVVWYRVEHTLSIHSILTRRLEAFYWLAVLFTFALGTAAGDLMAEPGPRLPGHRPDRGGVDHHHRDRLETLTQLRARVLDHLHPHPPARRIDRGLPVPTHHPRRPGSGHDGHQHDLRRGHHRRRHLPVRDQG